LYEDDVLIAISKPSGLLSHRGWANDRVTVMTWARGRFGKSVVPVHRLDRATSGVMLLCRVPTLIPALQEQFSTGRVVKNYLALTRGICPEAGIIDHGLKKSKLHERRPARTAVRRLHTEERYSLVEARPYTGRQHQVRRHLKHLSHPIIGDTRYGKGEHNRRFRTEFGLHRLALHASRLCVVHPTTGAVLSFAAELPEDLRQPLERFGVGAQAIVACRGPVWAPGPTDLPVLCQDEPTEPGALAVQGALD
jgi:tRNA pseudouridine65 synthase